MTESNSDVSDVKGLSVTGPGHPAPRKSSIAVISSRVLLGPQKRIIIQHQNEEYHLRQTKNGKLILTK
ncbi:hemin uptake protein HemP [Morganella psychrotolerans]|uniref:hemin uptake protein HemP n=1 Tax=Morganella psychrotolerans TaxID=368603 RepID=UPI0039AFBE92